MLVLTRKSGESIIIGENIHIKVLEIRGRQVRLGIEAPATVSIFRSELIERVLNENIQASQSLGENLIEIAKMMRKKRENC